MLPSGAKAPVPSGGAGLLDRERFSAGYASRLQDAGVAFAAFCRKHAAVTDPYLLPPHALDDLLYRFTQHCYKAGRKGGYAQALHAVLEAQVRRPRLKRRLQTVWSALWNWKLERPLHMRLPLPRPGLDALFAQAILNAFILDTPRAHLWIPVAVLLRLAFFGLLRPGEFTNLVRRQLVLPSQNYLGFGEQLVIAIESPKTRRFAARVQFAILSDPLTAAWAEWAFGDYCPSWKLFPATVATFDKLFKTLLQQLDLGGIGFSRGSLRAGGATAYFCEGNAVDWIRVKGRWMSQRTLEHYIQEGVCGLITSRFSARAVQRIRWRSSFAGSLRPPSASWHGYLQRPKHALKR